MLPATEAKAVNPSVVELGCAVHGKEVSDDMKLSYLSLNSEVCFTARHTDLGNSVYMYKLRNS